MRAPRPRAQAQGGAPKLPEIGVSSAVRRAFNAALHPRDANGRFRQTDNPQQQAPRRSRAAAQDGKPAAKKPTTGEVALKTSGVTGNDIIQVLSSRVRKYKGFTTVEAFVAAHPKGRAYALRTLAADQKAGRIGFGAAGGAKPATKEKITAKDETAPDRLPAAGTAERKFHDGIVGAANVFGDRAKVRVGYDESGAPRSINVDILNKAGDEEIGVIGRTFRTDANGSKVVDHGLFMLDETLQGAGQAKKFLARSVEAYKHIGIDKIALHADINVGGYAWLKYGFRPDRDGVASLTKHVNDRIASLRGAGLIDDALHGHLKRAVAFEDFSALADLGGKKKVEFNGTSQSLAKHLLIGSDWTGELDLHSRTAMNDFSSYIGEQK